MKHIFFTLAITAAILLSGCGAAGSVPAASSRADGSDLSDPAVSGAVSSVVSAEPQGTGFTLTSAVLSEDENRLLSLVGANALLYDYETSAPAVTVAVTSYQLQDGKLQELHTLTLPTPAASGRIAVTFNKMVEGFRVAVETSGGVNDLELDTDESFPEGTACVSWMAGKNGETYAYGEEVPLVSQVASTKDATEGIAAKDLLHHPELFADRGYEGVYLMTLTITPTT